MSDHPDRPDQDHLDPDDEGEDLDVAIAAYREGGRWRVEELPDVPLDRLEDVVAELRAFRGEGGTVGMLAVAEDFALVVRLDGPQVRVLLTDVDAAGEWDLAHDVVAHLGEVRERPYDEPDRPEAVGDLALLSDLGVGAEVVEELLEDEELYPEDVLADLAEALGFGEAFDDVTGLER